MTYRIFETADFSLQLEDIAHGGAAKTAAKLHTFVYARFEDEPHFGPNIKRLRGWEPPTWRYRIGDWRFFYEIEEKAKIVFMVAAHHRREACRR